MENKNVYLKERLGVGGDDLGSMGAGMDVGEKAMKGSLQSLYTRSTRFKRSSTPTLTRIHSPIEEDTLLLRPNPLHYLSSNTPRSQGLT